tara:strand:+ start:676 stop:1137 length:462 start_codon:yes stop_codon:yes gene_type:complete
MGMDVSGIGNEKAYFRASCWSWRPIHQIIEAVNVIENLEIDITGFGYNDGSGISDTVKCVRLSKAIRKQIKKLALSEDDSLYLALGSWCTFPDGLHVDSDKAKRLGLNKYNGTFCEGPISTEEGIVVPTHELRVSHLLEFCDFLEECQGFEIW